MTVLPPIFDTTLGLGATKLRDTCLEPILDLRGRFGTLATVVTFSPFWAGKFHRRPKLWCVIVHHCHEVSPTETKQKHPKRRDLPKEKQVSGSYASFLVSTMNMPWSGHGFLSTHTNCTAIIILASHLGIGYYKIRATCQ